ncbi:hypothetical protein L1987_03988 [Smallanthus sonchifolius]|uniref:Uncharacterized protein n=1 Tax=Smallanthus sonchifolius TaxID=185202 RepID=A0ACB9KC98_9ASTR|nr:hypothetical protein L1987_03988 [Smallanthus sonchifolius]
MQAVCYDSYGGGSASLKVIQSNLTSNFALMFRFQGIFVFTLQFDEDQTICLRVDRVDSPLPGGELSTSIAGSTPRFEDIFVKNGKITGEELRDEDHVEILVPAPGNGEMLIKMEAASLNPLDWKVQKGIARPVLPRKFPYVPVTDTAGEVVEVGPRVEKFKVGDKVITFLGGAGGGLAEYVVAKESAMAPRPPEVSAADGSCLVFAGCTALRALTVTGGLKLDKTEPLTNVLVTAGSGGVGHYAVQLAKLGNTHITATCGARNIEFVKSLGADEVLDYKTPEGAALKSPSGQKYDLVIHCATGIPWSTFKANLNTNGKVIDLTPNGGTFWNCVVNKLKFSKKQLLPLIMVPKAEEIECLVSLVKEGKLKTVIDSRYPLSRAEEGWAKIMEGHATGKVVVECLT